MYSYFTQCNDLRIFDVSGNKGFDTDTLIAVKHLNQQTKNEEREGILNMNFLGKSFLNENKQD